MNTDLYPMIFKRKSFHLFRNIGETVISEREKEEIQSAWHSFEPLCPEIRTAIRIVPAEETSCQRGEEYCILLYSEKKDHWLQNIGYLGEQLDLYLVSKDIGTLWFGIGKTEEKAIDDLVFVIMIAIRKIDDSTKFRKDMFKSKRRPPEEIWEGEALKGITDIVRFAPSACNTQPWFVKNEGKLLVYRYKKPGKRGIMPADRVVFYNQIDLGIFLCFMDLCLDHEGYQYMKELFADDGTDRQLTLNAAYEFNGVGDD